MEMGDFKWRQWPSEGASAASAPDTAPTKLASPPPDNSLEGLAARTVGAARAWVPALTPALMRESGGRADGGELPTVSVDNIWKHPNASPVVLLLLLLDQYGAEMAEWDPAVLLETLRRDGKTVSNANKVKILAARTLLTSPSPWRQWEVFHWVSLGLDGHAPNFVYLEEPEMGHLVAGWDLMALTDPAREPSEEVDKFVAAVFRQEGLPFIPEPLAWAQRELEDPQLHCEACDAIHRDDNDQRCITCGSPQLTKVPYEFAALRDEVRGLWMKLRQLPLSAALDQAPKTAAGTVVRRLLVHWEHADHARARMVQQLRMLGDK